MTDPEQSQIVGLAQPLRAPDGQVLVAIELRSGGMRMMVTVPPDGADGFMAGWSAQVAAAVQAALAVSSRLVVASQVPNLPIPGNGGHPDGLPPGLAGR